MVCLGFVFNFGFKEQCLKVLRTNRLLKVWRVFVVHAGLPQFDKLSIV